MKKEILIKKGEGEGIIDELINFLNEAKSKGATHYYMRWSNDQMWSFKWFETYRIKSEEELRQEEIQKLQQRIEELSKQQTFNSIGSIHPSCYNIAIREDGELFRIPKHLGYGDKIQSDKFSIIRSTDRLGCRSLFFDTNGKLRDKYWALERIMNLFKIFIPKEKSQVVNELESWTVTWYVKTGWSNDTKRAAKVFVKNEDAKEFEKQLIESAKFIGCWITTELIRN